MVSRRTCRKCAFEGTDDDGWYWIGKWKTLWYCRQCWDQFTPSIDIKLIKICAGCSFKCVKHFGGSSSPSDSQPTDKRNNEDDDDDLKKWYCYFCDYKDKENQMNGAPAKTMTNTSYVSAPMNSRQDCVYDNITNSDSNNDTYISSADSYEDTGRRPSYDNNAYGAKNKTYEASSENYGKNKKKYNVDEYYYGDYDDNTRANKTYEARSENYGKNKKYNDDDYYYGDNDDNTRAKNKTYEASSDNYGKNKKYNDDETYYYGDSYKMSIGEVSTKNYGKSDYDSSYEGQRRSYFYDDGKSCNDYSYKDYGSYNDSYYNNDGRSYYYYDTYYGGVNNDDNDRWSEWEWNPKALSSCCCDDDGDQFYPVVKPIWEEHDLPPIQDAELFDAHLHIDGLYEKDEFSDDANKFLNCFGPRGSYGPPEGVKRLTLITSACDLDSLDIHERLMKDTEDRVNEAVSLYFEIGWHPKSAALLDDATMERLQELITCFDKRLVAIGETGLDYSEQWLKGDDGMWSRGMPGRAEHLIQIKAFESMCDLAVEHDLPLCVHSREAEQDTFDVFEKKFKRDHKIQLHCFGNSTQFLTRLLKDWPNAYVSYAGHLTYSTADQWMVRPYTNQKPGELAPDIKLQNLYELVKQTPMDRILLETDGPYMAPCPFLGKSALPSHILFTAKILAELKEVSLTEILRQCRENSRVFFGV